tara:strand:+ start:625 stop:1260 length:636 start_codon:yes stop_codon:yes gene_type:complete
MSSIKLKHASGNAVSIAAPESNPASDRTLYVPSNANGTILTNTTAGCILQVKQNSDTTSTDSISLSSNGSYYDITNMTVAITPSSASNKILISFMGMGEGNEGDHAFRYRLKRVVGGATTAIQGAASGSRTTCMGVVPVSYLGDDNSSTPSNFFISNYLDSPSTTSEITYTVQMNCSVNSKTWYVNRSTDDSDAASHERGMSFITVMEVAA